MQAVWYERKGNASEVLQYGTMEPPIAGPGEVRVLVHASGVNPSDTKGRMGFGGNTAMAFPRVIPHQDGAGTIESVGEGVPESRIGERVWLYEAQWQRPFGTAAELTVVPQEKAVSLPDDTSFESGACLGVPSMTAHRCLFSDGPIEGQTVLITGGSGSVGYNAVQLAKWGGARVITTVSRPEQGVIARDGGADFVINYKTEDVAARVKDVTNGEGVDRVVDVSFVSNITIDQAVLKPNGVIAAYAATDAQAEARFPFYLAMSRGLTIHFVLVYVMPRSAHEAACHDIYSALRTKALSPRIAHTFALEQIAQAHDAVDSGRLVGKAIIKVC